MVNAIFFAKSFQLKLKVYTSTLKVLSSCLGHFKSPVVGYRGKKTNNCVTVQIHMNSTVFAKQRYQSVFMYTCFKQITFYFLFFLFLCFIYFRISLLGSTIRDEE